MGRELAASLFLTMGVALVPSVQNPIILYQIYPPAIDTRETEMLRNLHDDAQVLPSNKEGTCGVDHPCW